MFVVFIQRDLVSFEGSGNLKGLDLLQLSKLELEIYGFLRRWSLPFED